MPFTIAFVGVHGVGKTTTVKGLGYKVVPVEAIHLVTNMSPRERQVVFFVTFMNSLVRTINSRDNVVVMDNHPLQVLPYTEYLVGDPDLVASMEKLLVHAPRVDLLVFLDTDNVDVVLKRIVMRGRNVEEEARRDYVAAIMELTREYVKRLGNIVSRRVLVVDAELECSERVQLIRGVVEEMLRDVKR